MNPATQTYARTEPSDETAIMAIVERMIDAWNRGSAEGFAAPFSDDADFIAFEGTRLKGRRQIVEFHQHAFATVVKGTRLDGRPVFVRRLTPELAVMHAFATTVLAGERRPSPSRDSMQLFVVRKLHGRWQVEAVLNARRLTLERQALWDAFEALPALAQREVTEFVAALGGRS